MHHQKGHSLFEVLIALLLLSTFSLMWLKQEVFAKKIVNQLIIGNSGMDFLNTVEELLTINFNQFPQAPANYQFSLQKKSQQLILQLKSKSKFKELNRTYTLS